jgi:hypothetical protein
MVAMPMGVNLMAEQTIANVGAKPLRVGQPEQERHVIGHDRGPLDLQERIPVAGTLPGGASCEQALHCLRYFTKRRLGKPRRAGSQRPYYRASVSV